MLERPIALHPNFTSVNFINNSINNFEKIVDTEKTHEKIEGQYADNKN